MEVVVAKFKVLTQHLSEVTENYWLKLSEDDRSFKSKHLEQKAGLLTTTSLLRIPNYPGAISRLLEARNVDLYASLWQRKH
jgi:hypothetical protein